MATAKKKPATVKKVAPKKTTTVRKTTKKTVKAPAFRSFVKSAEPTPFLTFRLTQQSFYWLVFSLLALALGSWVLYLTVQIEAMYDQIDANTSLINTVQEKTPQKVQLVE